METVPAALGLAFILTTALAVGLFYWAAGQSRRVLGVLLGWLALQGAVAASGFYAVTSATGPPRLALALVPPVVLIIALFSTVRGRSFLVGLPPAALTLLHVVRVPVELVLLGLFLHGAVPKLMTFEGRNWDIFSGLSAPVVSYLVFRGRQLGRSGLLAWNIICLVLLLNVVVNAVLSVPSGLQQFGFEQPNVGVLHFPFIWLPACVVPLVLLAHLVVIWQLMTKKPLLGVN